MSQATAVYTVRVRGRNGDLRLLGDVDRGTRLDTVLSEYLHDFRSTSQDNTTSVHCSKSLVRGEEMLLVLHRREKETDGFILDSSGRMCLRLTPDHMHQMEFRTLFELPRSDVTGYLATEVKNGRSVVDLLKDGIQAKFHTDFPRLLLEIFPYVPSLVFRRVIEEGGIREIKFRRYERPTDRAVASVQKWGMGKTIFQFIPRSTMFDRLARMPTVLPRPLLKGEDSACGGIVEIRDAAAESGIVVERKDGTRRSFRFRHSGPAFTEEMIGQPADERTSPEADPWAMLREALRDVTS